MDMVSGYYNYTFVDEKGYYEINVWAGSFLVSAIMWAGYDSGLERVTVAENEVLQTDLTLYTENAVVSGYITDIDGNPIPYASVMLFDSNKFLDNTATTDEYGYYEINVHAGTYIFIAVAGGTIMMRGTVLQTDFASYYEPVLYEVNIPEGSTSIDQTLYPVSQLYTEEVWVTFSDWDHVTYEMEMQLSVNYSKLARLLIDYIVGNGDYSLDQNELDTIVEFMMTSQDGSSGFEESTQGTFEVDSIYYNPVPDTLTITFENAVGSWDLESPITVSIGMQVVSNQPIPDSTTHEIMVGEIPFDENVVFYITFPSGYAMTNYESISASVTGTTTVTIIPGSDPDPYDDIYCDTIWITVSSTPSMRLPDNASSNTDRIDTKIEWIIDARLMSDIRY